MKKSKSKIGWIIFLLFLMYASANGNYLNLGDDYLYKNSSWLALIDLAVCSVAMMIIPFIWRLVNREKLPFAKGKKICMWNSIILFILSIILMAVVETSFIGGLGALIYYYINKWLFVNEKDYEDQDIICSNCDTKVSSKLKKCPNCELPLNDLKKENNNLEVIYVDDIEDDDETIEETEINTFKCSNCGFIVKESDEKCSNCGEVFEDEDEKEDSKKQNKSDMDQKYSNLTKLKKLLDKKIISKEEFEKEKKKILNK
ncbi:MAG: SHOCT domain-containing protein [Bacilli bacterium]|nr:SHOCT domain-containing protein [Bacilli bacterium]